MVQRHQIKVEVGAQYGLPKQAPARALFAVYLCLLSSLGKAFDTLRALYSITLYKMPSFHSPSVFTPKTVHIEIIKYMRVFMPQSPSVEDNEDQRSAP
jgi:hypothetical protein